MVTKEPLDLFTPVKKLVAENYQTVAAKCDSGATACLNPEQIARLPCREQSFGWMMPTEIAKRTQSVIGTKTCSLDVTLHNQGRGQFAVARVAEQRSPF